MATKSLRADVSIPELVAAQAVLAPHATAVVTPGSDELTYGQLLDRADRIAAELLAAGIGPDDRVAVRCARSADYVVAALGIMRAGAAYVPVDPYYPQARQELMLDDAGVAIVLEGQPSQSIAGAASDSVGLDDLAYVIYTSGSTGRPKGVAVTHANLAHLVAWHTETFGVTSADRGTLIAGIGFDAAVWELWTFLANGASVVVVDETTRRSPQLLRDFLVEHRVTSSFVPTVLVESLIELGWPNDVALRHLHTGGEALRRRPPAGLPFVLVNNYGPAENTVVSLSGPVTPGEGVPTIGKPITGVVARVEDGELWLGGAGVARGYLSGVGGERFVTIDGHRWYRTGDLVRERADGDYDFVGRLDDQVQIRGYRVEPGEVEAVLSGHPEVSAAAIVPGTDSLGATCLNGYAVSTVDVRVLREWLGERLPAHMVPATLTVMAAFPVTANGKVDRAALKPARQIVGALAQTPAELALAEIWREVFGFEAGVDESFVELGGHSLHAVKVVGRIAQRFGVQVGFEGFFGELTIRELAASLPAPELRVSAPVEVERGRLSAAQRQYWIIDQLEDARSQYNIGICFSVSGELDVDALERALTWVVARHDVLRTAISDAGDGPRAHVVEPMPVHLNTYELSDVDAARRIFRDLAAEPFDLARPPLLRAALADLGAGEWQLCLITHHIAFDAVSIEVLLRELAQPSASVKPFEQVAAWEAAQPQAAHEAYWAEHLRDAPALLDLPLDRPRPAVPSRSGATVSVELPATLLEALDRLSRETQASRFMTVLSGLTVVLGRHAGQEDVVVGTPVANRLNPDFEDMIGCFVNTLALRTDLSGAPSFRELIARVRQSALDGYAHQGLPFDQVVELCAPQRGLSFHPLFQVMFAMQPEQPEVRFGGATVRSLGELHLDSAHFDLTVVVEESVASIRYATELFDQATVRRMLGHLVHLLTEAVAQPDLPIDELSLMDEADRAEVLSLGDGGTPLVDVERPAYLWFEEVAATRGDQVAVVCEERSLTYSEVDRQASGLAARLRSLGVGPEVSVAVSLPRSVDSVVAMLAVAKAGGCYVPMDPSTPDERLSFMLADSAITVAISTDPARLHSLGVTHVLPPSRDPEDFGGSEAPGNYRITGDELAYVIYTSGSTGKPKGVLGLHRGLTNLTAAKIERFDVRPDSRVLQFVSFSFGVSIADVYMTLCAGATLVMRGNDTPSGAELVGLAERERVTNLVLPASVLAAMPQAELPLVRSIVVGGEACSAALVRQWSRAGRRFVNSYGPTEATIATAMSLCAPDGRTPAVGRPIPGARVEVLDKAGRPVPIGVPGELFISGAGITRGYLNQPELTARQFQDGRYRTGDLARWREDGQLVLLRRTDDQVQVRGIRIELGDVEAALRGYPEVKEAAAAVHDDARLGQRLVGYVVGASADRATWRSFLAERVPEHLIPTVFVTLAALPRTRTGKLDRRALPAPADTLEHGRAAGSATERRLAGIWAEALGCEVGAEDDFFALGGQSITAASVMAQVRAAFQVGLPVRTLFEAPTVELLAQRIDQSTTDTRPALVIEPRPAGVTPLSAAQSRLWFLHQWAPASPAYNIPVAWKLSGEVDLVRLEQALTTVLRRHEVLRTRFDAETGAPTIDADASQQLVRSDEPILALARRPFDLAAELPIRAWLVGGDTLLLCVHHIAADGWAIGLLTSEISHAYNGTAGEAAPQYADVTYALRDRQHDLGYWVERLGGTPSAVELPTDRPRPVVLGDQGAMYRFALPTRLSEKLQVLGAQEKATSFMTLLAGFVALCSRYTGSDDIIVASPVAGRDDTEVAGVVGCFVNTLLLRTQLKPHWSARELLQAVRANVLADTEHGDLPYELLVDALPRGGAPLHQVQFVANNVPRSSLALADVEATEVFIDPGASKNDFSLALDDMSAGTVTYSTELFDEATVARMIDDYLKLLAAMADDPDGNLLDLPLGHVSTATPRPERSVLERFEEWASVAPDRVAVSAADGRLTYAEVDLAATALAEMLREQGAGRDTLVGLPAWRDTRFVVGVLGIWKAGAAYLPFEPDLPQARVEELLESASLVVGDSLPKPAATASRSTVDPASLAYVIHTSGSTGRPKGVAIEQRQLAAYAGSIVERLNPAAGSVFAVCSSLAADLGYTSLYAALASGGTVRLLEHATVTDPDAMAEALTADPVDFLKIVPSHLTALLDAADPAAVLPRVGLVLGGEASSWQLIDRIKGLRPGLRVLNHYGPTETTVGVLTHDTADSAAVGHDTADEPRGGTVPLGRPLPHVSVSIVDAQGRSCPVGVPGELVVGGASVARGYLGLPDDQRFAGGTYRTGDRVKWRAEGTVEFLGRIDRQIKIRGYRVEPGEIESVLKRHSGVTDAAVLGVDNRLVAFAVGAPTDLGPWLADQLPAHMIPAQLVWLDALPLTSNGKVDRAALQIPSAPAESHDLSEVERLVAEAVAEVLGCPLPGPQDDFFALGGHSLLAMRLVVRLRRLTGVHVALPEVFAAPTIAGLAALLGPVAVSTMDTPALVPGGPATVLSHGQRRLWFMDQAMPGHAYYNLPYALRLVGELDVDRLHDALNAVVAGHEVLRTSFGLDSEGEPVPVVADRLELVLPVTRVSEADLRGEVDAEFAKGFDLASGPVIRARLLRLDGYEHVLLVTLHHSVFDGWSFALFWDEVVSLYRGDAVERPALSYADYARWQQSLDHGTDVAWWVEELAGAPSRLDLPTDRPRPLRPAYRGSVIDVDFAYDERLAELARSTGATRFMVLLAAYQLLVARLAGVDDVVVGAPIAGRSRTEWERLLGFFVNMLPLRGRVAKGMTFREFLAQTRLTALGAFEHAEVPFEKLLEEIKPERDPSRPPVFSTMFTLQNMPRPALSLPGVETSEVDGPTGIAKYDMSLWLTEDGDRISGALEYSTELFDPATAARFAGYYQALLQAIAADPDSAVDALPINDAAERHLVLDEWNDTAQDLGTGLLPDLIDRHAASTPEATAVIDDTTSITYAELKQRSDALAAHLRTLGVGQGSIVGIAVQRSVWMVIAPLAVYKAGGAYLPLDPAYPAARLAYLLEDSGAQVLLHEGETWDFAGHTVDLREPVPTAVYEPVALDPQDRAYLIYTSGSTGKPKGVSVPHGAIANFVLAMAQEPGMGAGDVHAGVASMSFDASELDLWLPLTVGAAFAIITRQTAMDGSSLARRLAEVRATHLHATPVTWRMLLDAGWSGRDTLIGYAGGEALTPDLAARLAPELKELWNLYGPTEATVYCTIRRITDGLVTVGKPIPNTTAYVLDAQMRPVAIGVTGELCVGGVCLAHGYHNRPELSAERFVENPFGPGRLYRTGDLARWRADGEIEVLGRADGQVKLRGYRIEIGEIETALAAHPAVTHAVVDIRPDAAGEALLVAYVVGQADGLRDFLSQSLPAHMIPNVFIALEAMPINPNGKVDRKALPDPVLEASVADEPMTPEQTRIALAFSQVLGCPVGLDDDFFALGGDSMRAVRAVRAIDPALSVLDLFTHTTVRRLGAHLSTSDREAKLLHRMSAITAADAEVTVLAVPFGGAGAIVYHELAQSLPGNWACYSVQPPGRDVAHLDETTLSLTDLARACAEAILAEKPRQIVLYGHCAGASTATTISQALQEAGQPALGLAVGAAFPVARIPGVLGKLARLAPGRRQSDRALTDTLRALGGLDEELPLAERRMLAQAVRHDADQAEEFYSAPAVASSSPILVVVGGGDKITEFHAERSHEWQAYTSSTVDTAVLPQAGHFFQHEKGLAQILRERVRGWLAGQAPVDPPITPPAARLRSFLTVTLGQLVSLIGSGLATFGLSLWTYQQTGSVSAFAAIATFSLLPAILAAPLAGAAADRYDRRKVMLGCDLAGLTTAAGLIALQATGHLALWQLYVAVAVAAAATTFRQPAYLAAVTQLVPKRYLGHANGVVGLGTATGTVLSQLLGGALAAVMGLTGLLWLDLGTFAFSLTTLLVVTFPQLAFVHREGPLLKEITAGWRYLIARRGLVALAVFFAVANALGGVVIVLVTPLVLDFGSPALLGAVLAAQGVGLLAGSSLMAVWGGTRRRAAGMIAFVALFSVSALVIPLGRNAFFPLVGMFGIGVCASLINAHWLALVQVKVGVDLQGRILATCLMLARVMMPVGYLATGPLVDRVAEPLWPGHGMAAVIMATGLISLLWTFIGYRWRPLRDVEATLPDAPAMGLSGGENNARTPA